MEAMTEEKILSFFQGCIPTDFRFRTQSQANRILRLFAKVREELLHELQKIEGAEFCVVHAKNPHVPAGKFNLRFIVMKLNNGAEVGWYGGVMDINPSYLVPEDATHFHKTLKDMCDKHDASYYPRFKKWCDEYFFIPHRGETRGLGGIFFDNLTSEEEGNFSFLESCAKTILPAYLPILKGRMCDTYTDQEIAWKQLRNGRYTEFNLKYDKGFKFGLQLPGFQMETLFASQPPTASWGYKSDPEPGSREDELVQVLRCPQECA
ncbi:oxygen-dependent coproporphyrinogen-III oxidase, mitochondrial-like [Alosa pseudoharengus]|uniref:oxygen-dependent coproporphyrinogen-III oxidase, mitochondrial-like n=1 Tax=Alosa pseudoharengus TaxID=34774 RepID=UPI003F8BB0AD